jgi:TorA maturation chaperone TorD
MRLSLQEKISALFLCADILQYPTTETFTYLKDLHKLFASVSFDSFDNLKSLEAEYIKIFQMQSSKIGTVTNASWWIDGKLAGRSLGKIEDFYARCGYVFDKDNNHHLADSLYYMISFVAILAEEHKFDEINEFLDYLIWLPRLKDNLVDTTQYAFYSEVIGVVEQILQTFKEDR